MNRALAQKLWLTLPAALICGAAGLPVIKTIHAIVFAPEEDVQKFD